MTREEKQQIKAKEKEYKELLKEITKKYGIKQNLVNLKLIWR